VTPADRIDGTVLVTGGTGALGRAVLAELLDAGARVVTTWIAEREREAVAAELGSREGLELVEADLLSDEGPGAAVRAAAEPGPLAALVNLAGGYAETGRWHEGGAEALDRLLRLNLTTAVNSCREAVPAMIAAGGGSIVCVGAKAALDPWRGGGPYSVAKNAVLALVRSLDADYRADGVRANAILPSVIDTPANRESSPDADFDRWPKPVELARVIRFLCSPGSATVSGAAIPVYGRAG